ncbi:hypothetical protein Y032_0213g2308 [Ancylostoma ceylanicum]|uniref:Uncharacterized protein n=1 Tax=Ancylostoma ceylanicum TaxID=53326 RepID=A0A016SKJ4_9BILA|nr:hypothetical protein Y032_0213g2308 [Ancylostoma ceylanicum]
MPDDCCTAAVKSHRRLTCSCTGLLPENIAQSRIIAVSRTTRAGSIFKRNISGLETLKQAIDSPARYYISLECSTDMSGGGLLRCGSAEIHSTRWYESGFCSSMSLLHASETQVLIYPSSGS